MRLNTFFTRLWRGIVASAKTLKVNPRATLEGTVDSLDDAIRIVSQAAVFLPGTDAAKVLKELAAARKQAAKLLEAIRIAEATLGTPD
jgi:hypothetical protein